MEARTEQNRPTPRNAQKKTYAAPSLASYGSVEKLTQGSAGSLLEGMSGMAMV